MVSADLVELRLRDAQRERDAGERDAQLAQLLADNAQNTAERENMKAENMMLLAEKRENVELLRIARAEAQAARLTAAEAEAKLTARLGSPTDV
jgi:hypothetical protein